MKTISLKNRLLAMLAFTVIASAALPHTAKADDDDWRGRGRGYERHEEEWRRHEWEVRHHRHLYPVPPPAVVYAPPPVVYAPPEPTPGINLVIPLHFH